MFNVEAHKVLDTDLYLQNSIPQTATAFKNLAKSYDLIDSLPCPSQALDVGCGTGNVTRFISGFTNLTRIVGIDPVPEMIKVANLKSRDKRTEFHEGNIVEYGSLPVYVRDGKCGLVTSFSVLHWIRPQATALENIYKCLAPGGYFLAVLFAKKTNWYQSSYRKLQSEFGELREDSTLLLDYDWKTEDPETSYKVLLQKVGFTVIRCEHVPVTFCYSDADMEGLIKTIFGKQISKVSLEKQDKATDLVRRCFLDVSSIPEKGYVKFEDSKRFFVVCQKPN